MRWRGDPPDGGDYELIGQRPERVRGSMLGRWRQICGPTIIRHGGSYDINPRVFNANLRTLREDYSDDEIIAGMHTYRASIVAGTISVGNRHGWFQFFGARRRFIRHEIDTTIDPLSIDTGPSEDPLAW
jgi:hypothetical protein